MTCETYAPPKVGDRVPYWFNRDGTVLEVRSYRGKYPQWFSHVIKLTAPNTKRGWMETVVGPGTD